MQTEHHRIANLRKATQRAKKTIKPGDRVTCTKCPGTKRWFKFDHWQGQWMASATGVNDYHAANVSRVNGQPVDFTKE